MTRTTTPVERLARTAWHTVTLRSIDGRARVLILLMAIAWLANLLATR